MGAFTEQLVFTSSEGGVAFDAVTGIDADGVRSPGLMRCEGEHLDLILPGAFVEEARMPLTLDPLVSGQFTVGGAGSSLVTWDVSYDATSDVFLVAWTESRGGPHYSMGRRVSTAGALLGPPLCLECPTQGYVRGIGNIDVRNSFVVWMTDAAPVTVDAATGEVRALSVRGGTSIAAGTSIRPAYDVVVSGNVQGDDRFVVVEHNRQTQGLRAVPYRLDATGTATATGSAVQIVADGGLTASSGYMSITRNPGIWGRRLLVWDNQGQIYGAILDGDLNILDQGLVWQSEEHKAGPIVAGDGRQWVVAYKVLRGSRSDVDSVPVFWDEAAAVGWVGASRILGRNFGDAGGAGWLGESCLVASLSTLSFPPG